MSETMHPDIQTPEDRRDALISRVIDGEATERDWSALRSLAEADPRVWTDLAQTQRQHEALCRAVEEVGDLAERYDLPERELLTPTERFEMRMNAVRAWGGWAAAAAVLLVWFTGLPAPMHGGPGGMNGAGGSAAALGPDLGAMAPDEALERYLDRGRQTGRVLAEVPERVVLETRPLGQNAGVEVVYLRQILEREVIAPSQVYRLGRNEWGQAALLPAESGEGAVRRVSY